VRPRWPVAVIDLSLVLYRSTRSLGDAVVTMIAAVACRGHHDLVGAPSHSRARFRQVVRRTGAGNGAIANGP
jgi:hypothetical protein